MSDTKYLQDVGQYVQSGFSGNPDELISMLQHCQKTYGYISRMVAEQIADSLGMSTAQVYSVASFFAQFRFEKPGENHIRVCLGTACHVQSGQRLSQEIQARLHIQSGQTTPDGRFDFEEVACLGCCAQAPVLEVNGKIYAKMTPEKLRKVLDQYERA